MFAVFDGQNVLFDGQNVCSVWFKAQNSVRIMMIFLVFETRFSATMLYQTNPDSDNAQEVAQQRWIKLIQMMPVRLVF